MALRVLFLGLGLAVALASPAPPEPSCLREAGCGDDLGLKSKKTKKLPGPQDAVLLQRHSSLVQLQEGQLVASVEDGNAVTPAEVPRDRAQVLNKSFIALAGGAELTGISRRAVFVRWGSLKCPIGAEMLYSGFMANEHRSHTGGGFNYLCMHPDPQFPM